MSALHVEPTALHTFASRLTETAEHVAKARSYIRGYTGFTMADHGLMGQLRSAHEDLTDRLDGRLWALERSVDRSALEVQGAASYYAATDLDRATEIDRTFESPGRPSGPLYDLLRPPHPLEVASIWRDPTVHLVDPGEPSATIGNGYVDPGEFLDYISISGAATKFIEGVTGFNVIEWLTKPFAGDWRAFAQCGMALDHLAVTMSVISSNIRYGIRDLDKHWTGNAADSAYLHFTGVAAAISQVDDALKSVSDQYLEAARGTWLIANQMGDVITQLADAATIEGISLLANLTGVGALVGVPAGAWAAKRIFDLVRTAKDLLDNLGSLLATIAGAIMIADVDGVTTPSLPNTPYDHPVVRAW